MVAEIPFIPEQSRIASIGEYSLPSDRHPETNEDSSFVMRSVDGINGLALGVFDGVGGGELGEVASRMGKKSVLDSLSTMPAQASPDTIRQTLCRSLTSAHEQISRKNPKMATTACVGYIQENQGGQRRLYVASAGDSRCYVLRSGGQLECITIDDNLEKPGVTLNDRAMQALLASQRRFSNVVNPQSELTPSEQEQFSKRNYITNCVGGYRDCRPQVYEIDLGDGDRVLFTSDGIHDNLTENEIQQIAESSTDSQRIAKQLVEMAQRRSRIESHPRHKPDDMTAVMVSIPKKAGIQQMSVNPSESANVIREVYRGGIAEATNLDQLSQALDRLGSVRNAEGTEYSAQHIKDAIAEIKKGKASIATITRAGGLRTKVAELVLRDSSSFDELYCVLDALGDIEGSQEVYSPSQLRLIIDRVRKGELDIDTITNGGSLKLRSKVDQLLTQENPPQTSPRRVTKAENDIFNGSFSDAHNFGELFQAINREGVIEGTNGTYTAEQLRHMVNEVRSRRLDPNYIPRTNGLRMAVLRLISGGR